MKRNSNLDSFIETGLWSTLDYYKGDDSHNPPLDESYSIHDVNTAFLKECDKFIDAFLELATPYFTDSELEHSPIAHDLWLTVEGHGTGFWDGDYKNGDKLTEIVESMGFHDSYFGDKLNESIQRGQDNE